MTSTHGRGLLHLAAAVDQSVAGRQARPDVDLYVEAARLAESGGLDFVTLGDSFAQPGPDALGVLARIAPATARIGLVATGTTTHAEPFHAWAALATLDRVSGGRAGRQLDVPATGIETGSQTGSDAEAWTEAVTQAGARLFGRRRAAPGGAPPGETGEVADRAARLWDGVEGDAGTRDLATGRFVGEGRPHHGDFESVGFSGTGPSAVPRPSQGHPVRVVDATEGQARRLAARYADVVLVRAVSAAQAGAVRDELRVSAADSGRDPDELRVLASLVVDLGGGEYAAEPGHGGGGPRPSADGPLYRGGPVDLAELITAWHASGVVDGFHLVPAEPRRDLERLVNGTVALLQHRSLFRTFYPGSTLREHLGLARPVKQCAGPVVRAGGAS
ncbi:LLM class flavin-dependent oxidoreductase [Streptomyces sp. WI04-05B]|uniref:LLM class flavin-dependent oxidoreductase n=1 Tax=Streptomyces TaxID=1883 RepID=UPI0029A2D245|nr:MULTISPECIES: LLM class flavin-dependent oxidoreductase [unclassified Streptomyces]MDX2547254.1 LLM class flavin-dependent oxidoreductase [Streptomyces sp. WI04-05B]MDX2590176.1 LLM class flavin-dependent oxidoreductase [Streptomyces sp. WI04-05A]